MILAAGRGKRMRPLTDDLPKPLLKVGGKSLIEWHLEKLARAGCHEIVINHSHLGHRIESALGDGRRWKARIYYCHEPEALGTAGGIVNALDRLGTEPFAVVNGDIYTDYDFELLVHRLRPFKAADVHAHLVMVNNPSHHPQGDFALANGRITLDDGNNLTYSGMALFKPEMFQGIAKGNKEKLGSLLKQSIRRELVSGELFQGTWVDVGTPARLQDLDEQLRSKAVRP
jgi:MurNAc alpha-1-phosphate uridylyltransferase